MARKKNPLYQRVVPSPSEDPLPQEHLRRYISAKKGAVAAVPIDLICFPTFRPRPFYVKEKNKPTLTRRVVCVSESFVQ